MVRGEMSSGGVSGGVAAGRGGGAGATAAGQRCQLEDISWADEDSFLDAEIVSLLQKVINICRRFIFIIIQYW
jgi:hypothetical protein